MLAIVHAAYVTLLRKEVKNKLTDTQYVSSKIIEINQSNIDPTVKEITMLIHKIDVTNGNGLDFKKDYTEKYMKTLVDKPVVCKYHEKKNDLGTHEQVIDKKTGKIVELLTIAIGTITDVWIGKVYETDETEALYAKATIWAYKYPKIMECIEKHVEDGLSRSSVEVEIHKYGDNPTKEYRYATEYTYIGNCLLGSTIKAADSDAGITDISDKEIAAAIIEDLDDKYEISTLMKGDDNMPEADFNKGFDIRYHSQTETNALKLNDVSSAIYNTLNPLDPKNNQRKYNYYILDVYVGHVIVEDWHDYKTLYKINYTISGDSVILDADDKWLKGYKGFIPDGVDIDKLIADLEVAQQEANAKVKEVNDLNEEQVKEMQVQLETLKDQVTELNSTIVTQREEKLSMDTQVTELNQQIEELKTYKEQFETAQKEVKEKELSQKYSKLLSKETLESDSYKNALSELNEVALNQLVVDEVTKEKAVEVNSEDTDVTIVVNGQHDDLIPETVLSKYGFNN